MQGATLAVVLGRGSHPHPRYISVFAPIPLLPGNTFGSPGCDLQTDGLARRHIVLNRDLPEVHSRNRFRWVPNDLSKAPVATQDLPFVGDVNNAERSLLKRCPVALLALPKLGLCPPSGRDVFPEHRKTSRLPLHNNGIERYF